MAQSAPDEVASPAFAHMAARSRSRPSPLAVRPSSATLRRFSRCDPHTGKVLEYYISPRDFAAKSGDFEKANAMSAGKAKLHSDGYHHFSAGFGIYASYFKYHYVYAGDESLGDKQYQKNKRDFNMLHLGGAMDITP